MLVEKRYMPSDYGIVQGESSRVGIVVVSPERLIVERLISRFFTLLEWMDVGQPSSITGCHPQLDLCRAPPLSTPEVTFFTRTLHLPYPSIRVCQTATRDWQAATMRNKCFPLLGWKKGGPFECGGVGGRGDV